MSSLFVHRVVSSRANKNINNILDRHNLAQIKERFLQLNQQRINRAQSILQERQRIFLDALPLLFHVNHPMLPGYVGQDAPCGIRGFSPTKSDLVNGRSFAKSFAIKPYGFYEERILGIYVMGSLGTIAQNKNSDIDIWLCCAQDITMQESLQLKDKCDKITLWADTLNLEVHFFLMDCNVFRNGKVSDLDEESSGTAQHYLLLDEFYRTSIHIAGCYPLWWFVPVSKENDYDTIASMLINNQFIDPKSVLDFGPIAKIPINEFFGATIWQLYKAIESPYKSILKLFMLEAYFTEYDEAKPLSLVFKDRVYQGLFDIDSLDPYIMVYQSIDLYLESKGQADRLDIARRCFYFKVNKPLSQKIVANRKVWQRERLQKMVSQWGWSEDIIEQLDRRSNWKTKSVVAERNSIIKALNGTYQNLCFGIDNLEISKAISSKEINILGRKLKAAFDRRPGKIELINLDLSRNIVENRIRLEKYDDGHVSLWQMCVDAGYHGGVLLRRTEVLSRYASLIELIVWACLNGVMDKNTKLDLSSLLPVNLSEINQLIRVLNSWLDDSRCNAPHSNFRKAVAPEKLLMFINVDVKKENDLSDSYYTSRIDDVFNYGGGKVNLISSIDLVEKNSWNEISVKRFEGEQAVYNFLEHYLSMVVPGSLLEAPPLDIYSVENKYGESIIRRLKTWLSDVMTYHKSSRNGQSTTFVSQLANRYCVLEFMRGRFNLQELESTRNLMLYLSEPRSNFSALVIDRVSVQHALLQEISVNNTPGSIEIYIEHKKDYQQICICDERGSLVYERIPINSFTEEFYSLYRFIRNTIPRLRQYRLKEIGVDDEVFSKTLEDDVSIQCFDVVKNNKGRLKFKKRDVAFSENQKNAYLQVSMYVDEANEVCYDFKFEEHYFTWSEWHADIFMAVSQIVSTSQAVKSSDSLNATIYTIDEIDVSACETRLESFSRMQLGQYLHLKHSLESRLKHSS